jgi:hypothetical protein
MDRNEIGSEVIYRIYLDRNRAQWPALVNTVINPRVV